MAEAKRQADLAERTAARFTALNKQAQTLADRRAALAYPAELVAELETVTPEEALDLLKAKPEHKDGIKVWYDWATDEDRREFDRLLKIEKEKRQEARANRGAGYTLLHQE